MSQLKLKSESSCCKWSEQQTQVTFYLHVELWICSVIFTMLMTRKKLVSMELI